MSTTDLFCGKFAVTALRDLGADVELDESGYVVSVNFSSTKINDDHLEYVAGLTTLERL